MTAEVPSQQGLESRDFRLAVGEGPSARDIAVIASAPAEAALTLVWCGGYRSDMSGTKALALEQLAGALGVGCLRFDYSGHGASGGDFIDGTISRWLEEALAVISKFARGRLVLVGSSMGAWIALRAAQELKAAGQGARIAGMVLIAPAPDFTSDLVEPNMNKRQKAALEKNGYFTEKSQYGPEPDIYTKKLIEDGRANRVLTGTIDLGCPVHILQGVADRDVPYAHALKLMEHLPADDVVVTLVADGDHRLSRPQDLEKISDAVKAIVQCA